MSDHQTTANKAYVVVPATGGRTKLTDDLNRWADKGYRLHTVRGDWYVMELVGRFDSGSDATGGGR